MDLIVFDKDGTLTETASGEIFPKTPEDQRLKFDTDRLPSNAYIAVASNQKGLFLGHKTREFLEAEFAWLEKNCLALISLMVACPDNGETVLIRPEYGRAFIHFNKQSMFTEHAFLKDQVDLMGTFRKPQAGMLKLIEAIATWTPDGSRKISRKIFIGKNKTDQQAAEKANFKYWDVKDWLAANEMN